MSEIRPSGTRRHDLPTLSIVIPCYNAEKTLRRCIDSIINQTSGHIQVVCVNDGSTDGTLSIIKSYVRDRPDTITCIDIPNGGSAKARMMGLGAATGTYVGFLDSDDYLDPSFAEKMLAKADETKADMVVCGYRRINAETGEELSQELCSKRPSFKVSDDPGLTVTVNSALWNKIYRTSTLSNAATIPSPPPIAEDFLVQTLFFLESEGSVVFVAEPLVNYLVHPHSLMTSVSESDVQPTYRAMADVRQILAERHATSDFIEAFDTSAFLHLGISLNHALSDDDSVNLPETIAACTEFLDSTCPLWRHSRYLSLRYASRHGAAYQRLRLAWLAYKAGLMVPFLKTYRLAITKLGITIKW